MEPKKLRKEVSDLLEEIDNDSTDSRAGPGPGEPPKQPGPKWILEGIVFIFLFAIVIVIIATHSSPSASGPLGKITAPLNNSKSSRTIKISGYTKNLPPDRPYVTLAVDVKGIGLCWPKKPFIHPNTQFQATFHEGGPAGTCCVSLYAVNRDLYEKIKQWFEEQRLSGMPIFPNRYRLDSVNLTVM